MTKPKKICRNCYGKGYSTCLAREEGYPDFIGDKGYAKIVIQVIPCRKCRKWKLSKKCRDEAKKQVMKVSFLLNHPVKTIKT